MLPNTSTDHHDESKHISEEFGATSICCVGDRDALYQFGVYCFLDLSHRWGGSGDRELGVSMCVGGLDTALCDRAFGRTGSSGCDFVRQRDRVGALDFMHLDDALLADEDGPAQWFGGAVSA